MTHQYDMPGVKHCRSCGAAIYWLKHQTTGKVAPIDAFSDPAGNIVVALSAGVYWLAPKERLEAMRAEGAPLHTNHFQTCPAAGAWKRHGGSGMR